MEKEVEIEMEREVGKEAWRERSRRKDLTSSHCSR